ncbi:MAG: sugar-binding protein [Telluria sp.]
MNKLLPLCASLLLAASPAYASFQAHRLDAPGAVKLDGKLDEAAWALAPVHDTMFENAPQDRVPAKFKTEVRILYDAQYLYIGIKAYDAHPEQIRSPFVRRDKISGDQDFLGVYLDSSGAKKAAQFIYFNARGAFSDGNFSNTDGEDTAPDIDFDIATARFDGGWSAELRIPFTSVPYVAGSSTPWNFMVFRNLPREVRYKMFSGEVTKSSNCLLCATEPLEGLHDLPSGLKWTATPQLVLRKGRERVDGTPDRNYFEHDLSLDVKVRPDSATTIDATINPDFSQVELDAPQLSGNTRFGLFQPEKRPFFLEGSDIYNGLFRAINTRSMTDPAWGARYTRRDATSDVTAMVVHDTGGGLVMLPQSFNTDYAPQDFHSVATVARAVHKGEQLSVGALVSDRTIEDDRGYNRVLGADFIWQRSDSARLQGQFLQSATTAQPDANGELRKGPRTTGHAATVGYTEDTDRYGLFGALEQVTPGFRDDNGFISQAGEHMWATELTRKFGQQGRWDETNFYFHAERKFDENGKVIYNDFTPGLFLRGPYDTQLNFRVRPWNAQRVAETGPLFKTQTVWARIDTTPSKLFARLSAEVELGDEVDILGSRRGRGGVVSLFSRLRPHDRFELEAQYNATWVNGRSGPEDGHRLYAEQALQVNAIVHFSPHDWLRTILQKSRTTRNPGFYAFPVAARSTGGTSSFVYGHTAGLGTAAYVGLTLSDGETPGFDPRRRQNELFVKLSWQI